MNDHRCPQCNLLNLPSAGVCLKCGAFLGAARHNSPSEAKTAEFQSKRPATTFSEGPTEQFAAETSFTPSDPGVLKDGKTGSRTYFWYRLMCSVAAVSGIVLAIIGFVAILGSLSMEGQQASDGIAGGIFFVVCGLVPAAMYLVGVAAPPRSWSWIWGMILIIVTSFSCFLLPLTIPLFYFWMKSETQAFFERT